jgi:hypothetical protein
MKQKSGPRKAPADRISDVAGQSSDVACRKAGGLIRTGTDQMDQFSQYATTKYSGLKPLSTVGAASVTLRISP